MEPTFNSLIAYLEEQKKIHEELLLLGKTKQTELIKGSLEALDLLTKREESLIFHAGRLEEDRQRCAHHMLALCGLDETATLKELILAAPGETRGELERLHHEMSGLLKEMRQLNQENMNLIQQSLTLINQTMDAISQVTSSTYTADKEVRAESVSRLVDKKA